MNFHTAVNNKRDNLIIQVISFFWLLAKFWSLPAWSFSREVPLVSFIFDSQSSTAIIFVTNIISIVLLLSLFLHMRRWVLAAVIFFEIISICFDYLLLQPWEYIYLSIFLISFINYNDKERKQYIIVLFLSSIYIFSGLHKLNRNFLVEVWNRFILTDFFGLSQEIVLHYKLFFLGLSIPLIELTLGIGLLTLRLSKKVIPLLILLHLIILVVVGPLGKNYNSIIWFWNFAMIALLLLTFESKIQSVKINAVWYLWIFAVPFAGIIIGWNSYLTFNLYAGKNEQLYIYSKNVFPEKMPAHKLSDNADGYQWYVNLQEWVMQDTTLPPIPEKWYMEKMKQKLLERFPESKIILISPTN